MTEKTSNNPFAALWTTDLNAAWQKSLKPSFNSVLDANEQLSKEVLTWYERVTGWTAGTPLAPLCKTSMTAMGKMVEYANGLVRKTWHIDQARDGPEPMPK